METKNSTSSSATLQHEKLVISRIFDAPVERVWKFWTEPESLKRWWGPKDFTAPHCDLDLREGGKYLFCMRSPEGRDYWSTGVYRQIIPFKRIVCTDSFSDEKGNVVAATYYGMSADFPLELNITVRFEDVNGKTRVTIEHEGLPGGKDLTDCREGWSQSLDKLDSALK